MQLLDKALAKSPDDRISSAAELLRQLEVLCPVLNARCSCARYRSPGAAAVLDRLDDVKGGDDSEERS